MPLFSYPPAARRRSEFHRPCWGGEKAIWARSDARPVTGLGPKGTAPGPIHHRVMGPPIAPVLLPGAPCALGRVGRVLTTPPRSCLRRLRPECTGPINLEHRGVWKRLRAWPRERVLPHQNAGRVAVRPDQKAAFSARAMLRASAYGEASGAACTRSGWLVENERSSYCRVMSGEKVAVGLDRRCSAKAAGPRRATAARGWAALGQPRVALGPPAATGPGRWQQLFDRLCGKLT